ncbi:hypothetical protein DH86_00003812, partial [Scytalidium sp. 3C]
MTKTANSSIREIATFPTLTRAIDSPLFKTRIPALTLGGLTEIIRIHTIAGRVVELPYGLDKDAIITDLTTERPQWILSAYGPGRMAPAQLFGGPLREQSFEEMRLLYHLGLSSGNPQQAIQHANQLQQAAEQQIETVLRDIDGAISYIIDSEKTHPNRIDICRGGHLGDAISQPLGQPSTTANFPLANRASVNMQPTSGSSFGPTSGIGGGSFGK